MEKKVAYYYKILGIGEALQATFHHLFHIFDKNILNLILFRRV